MPISDEARKNAENFIRFVQGLNKLRAGQNKILWNESFRDIKLSEYVMMDKEEYILKVVKPDNVEEDAEPEKLFAMELFEALFDCKNTIRNKDGVQMYLCNGFLKHNGHIDRANPLVKQRVMIEFDPNQNAIMIKHTDTKISFSAFSFIDAGCSINDHDIEAALSKIEEENLCVYDEKMRKILSAVVNSFTSQGTVAVDPDMESNAVYVVYLDPCFSMERIEGNIEGYIYKLLQRSALEEDCYSIPFLQVLDLIPINKNAVNISEDFKKNLLLSINEEQKKALASACQNELTVVQGPPGTGKTRMSVNMIAQATKNGESVLFTSRQKSSIDALYALIPEEIREFCIVEKNDGNANSIIKTIENIEYLTSNYGMSDIDEKLKRLTAEKDNCRQYINEIFNRNRRSCRVSIDGASYSMEEIGEYVFAHKELLQYIPGRVDEKFNLTDAEIDRLYDSNNIQNEWCDLREYKLESISPENILQRAEDKRVEQEDILSDLYKITMYFEALDDSEWACDAAIEPEDGFLHQFAQCIDDCLKYHKRYIDRGKTVDLGSCRDALLDSTIPKIVDEIENKGRISKSTYLTNSSFRSVLKEVHIDGRQIESIEDCKTVGVKVLLNRKKAQLRDVYEEFISHYPGFQPIETVDIHFFEEMYRSLDIVFDFPKIYQELKAILAEINAPRNLRALCLKDVPGIDEIEQIIAHKAELNILYNELNAQYNEEADADIFSDIVKVLDHIPMDNNVLYDSLKFAAERADFDSYKTCYDEFESEYNRYVARNVLLERLEWYASSWAEAIRERRDIHGQSHAPENIGDAIKAKKMLAVLKDYFMESQGELISEKVKEQEAEMERLQREIVYWNMARGLLEKFETNSGEYGRDLRSFKLIVEKIGAGKGKKAQKLKQEQMAISYRLRSLLPIWILPMRSLYDFEPAPMFDLMICDEASTSDIKDILLLNLARRAMIIGDPEQVTPVTIGVNADGVSALQTQFLGGFEKRNLYDESTSLFSIASMNIAPVVLRMHYRCHPSIIRLSNELAYNRRLVPVKPSLSILKPVVDSRVKEGKKNSNNVNVAECDQVVEIVKSILEDPRYDQLTIGIISLKGDNQAQAIQRKLLATVSLSDLEKHEIIAETVISFQGLERDVVIISCVDSVEENGVLRLEATRADNPLKKRLNVAFSRGKQQVFIVHSYDKENLHQEDLRQHIFRMLEDAECRDDDNDTTGLNNFQKDVYEKCLDQGIPVKTNVSTEYGVIPICILDAASNPIILHCISQAPDKWKMEEWEGLMQQGYRIQYVFAEEFYMKALREFLGEDR